MAFKGLQAHQNLCMPIGEAVRDGQKEQDVRELLLKDRGFFFFSQLK